MIEPNRYFQEISEFSLITPERENELAAAIARGDDAAFSELVHANLRLVVSIAYGFGRALRIRYDDLISVGNIGLMKAAKLYDPAKANGGKFSSYAAYWIKHGIRKELGDHFRTVRVPIHVSEIRRNALAAISRYSQSHGGEVPSNEWVAAELGEPQSAVNRALSAQGQSAVCSLDAETDDEGATVMSAMASATPDPYQQLEVDDTANFRLRTLATGLSSLGARDRSIMIDRFGLSGENPKTLEEIGLKHKVCRERIRQIEASALKKLRTAVLS